MFEPKVFWEECTVLKKVLATLLGPSAPLSDSNPGVLCPPCPLVTPLRLRDLILHFLLGL